MWKFLHFDAQRFDQRKVGEEAKTTKNDGFASSSAPSKEIKRKYNKTGWGKLNHHRFIKKEESVDCLVVGTVPLFLFWKKKTVCS
jgi:hypothetical protein